MNKKIVLYLSGDEKDVLVDMSRLEHDSSERDAGENVRVVALRRIERLGG